MNKLPDDLLSQVEITDAKDGIEPHTCPSCTAAEEAGAKFCPQCGLGLSQGASENAAVPETDTTLQETSDPDPKTPAAVPICQCGQDLPEDAAYCYRCGSSLGQGCPPYRLAILGAPTRHVDLGDEAIIGKDRECDVVLPNDGFVSRRHARISHSDSTFLLEDLGSANGTLLRIRRSIMLEVGDEIVVGKTVLRLEQVGSNGGAIA